MPTVSLDRPVRISYETVCTSISLTDGESDGTCPAPASNPSTAESGFGDLVVGNAYCGEISADVPIAASKRAEPTQRVKQI